MYAATAIDPWFLREIEEIVATERELAGGLPQGRDAWYRIKRMGFSDKRISQLAGVKEGAAREARWAAGVRPVFKRVDTCAAEFEAHTPYLYSTYEEECEAAPTDKPKVMILGGGPNRIGQGIEFDYCCVHAAFALTKAGFETIMVNCNPETVSTDYDTSDRLYFEPLTLEDVLEIVHKEKPKGLIVQYGGQTPLKLAVPLHELGVPIFGTSPDAIDRAEDRERFAAMIEKLKLRQPENGMARSAEQAFAVAKRIGYPVMVRPSYVLGGRAMEVVYDDGDLRGYLTDAVQASNDRPVLIDRFLKDAAEVDVDVVSDGKDVVVGGVMEHIEEAGIHSGDSACSLPPFSLAPELVAEIERQSIAMARELGRDRPDERPVRRAGQGHLRARGQPARQPHRAVRGQGHRPAAGQGRRPLHGGQDAGRGRRHQAVRPQARLGQGGGLPLHPLPRASTTCSGRRCAPPAR